MIGQVIGHYRIEEKLGEGGMGVVYRARDTNLNRSVAIKFLPADLADEERRRRFQQEAQTASSLNHPHILSVYEAGAVDGRQYLITEFVDGGTLRDWARREKPSLRQIAELAAGVADALSCAHHAGIVHRDIKPENILVSKQGYAKLVDFGLAKLTETGNADDLTTKSLAAVTTRPGFIVGTVAYMSPEQASGKPADARTDIFAFGVVLYELLDGRRPFTGRTDLEVLQGILHAPPQPFSRPDVRFEFRMIVEKALEKDPADRYQSMRDMVVDLRRIQRHKSSDSTPLAPVVPAVRRPRWPIAALLAETAVLLALAIAGWLLYRSDFFWRNPLANAQFTRFTDFEGSELDASISTDGKFVTFLSDRDGPFDAWVTQIGTGEFMNLTKGRNPDLMNDGLQNLGFSGDGTHVWMRIGGKDAAGRRVGETIMMAPAIGGTPRLFLESGVSVTWSPDGARIVYHTPAPGDPIFIAERNGRNPKQIFRDISGMHCHFPIWSPDGQFIYFVRGLAPNEMDIWRVPADAAQPGPGSAPGKAERLTRHHSRVGHPAFLDKRTLVYVAKAEDGSGPWLYGVDVQRKISHRLSFGVEQYISIGSDATGRHLVATVSNPVGNLWTVPIGDGIAEESAASRFSLPTVRAVSPRFAQDSLIYLFYLSSTGGGDGLWRWKDGVASELWKPVDGAVTDAPAISPDRRQICFAVRKPGQDHNSLMLMTSEGAGARPFAESLEVRSAPSWSPDGKWVAVAADDAKGSGLFKVPVDGGAPFRLVNRITLNPLWSPDGRFIVYSEAIRGRSYPVKAVTPDGQPFPLHDLEVLMGGDRYRFLPNGKGLVLMLGEYQKQNFWLLDFTQDSLRQLTNLRPGASFQSFDIAPDGKQILFDRGKPNSDIVLIDLPR